MSESIVHVELGTGPLVATAIHDGHVVRDEVAEHMALSEAARLREEDPFTGSWTQFAPTRIVGVKSRFEVDLNRRRAACIYRSPADAWGLDVWRNPLPDAVVARTLAEYDAFYAALEETYTQIAHANGPFVVYDLHSYNHRRHGPEGPVADPIENPQVNVGTGTLGNRAKFNPLVQRFIADLAQFDFPGGRLDVRENIKFFGGQHPRWTHEKFPDQACVLAIEFKKFFMDEWTGIPNQQLVDAVRQALASTVPGVLEELEKLHATSQR